MAQVQDRALRVFLSGGTHSDWRSEVRRRIRNVEFYDPQTLSGHESMQVIADTERGWLDETDIVLFYLEKTNPSGLGSAFEIGYAVAKGIPVIFVDEKRTSHTEWLGVHCTKVAHELVEGISALVDMIAAMKDNSPKTSVVR